MTHVRKAPGATASLCGLAEATSTVSQAMLTAMRAGEVVPFSSAVAICPVCESVVATGTVTTLHDEMGDTGVIQL